MRTEGLRPFGPADFATVAAAGPLGGEPTCDLSPAALRIWRDCEAPSVGTVAGNLCIRLDPHHEAPYFLEPLGTGDLVASVDACLAVTGRVSRVREALASRLPADRYDVVPIRDHFDYVYDVHDLATLTGPAHVGQRNRMRKFAREHPGHEFRAVAATDAPAALRLFERWRAGRTDESPSPDAGSAPSDACQRRALERAFEDFDALGLTGGAVLDGGEMLGFLLASRAGSGTIAHFLYAEPGLAGVSQTLLTGCCRGAFAGSAFLDLEEDLGLAGLRRTKLAWQPARLVPKYLVTRR